jgi:eukaryotic-like serine/threonine-protein kinase
VRKSGLLEPDRFDAYLNEHHAGVGLPREPKELATSLIRDGLLTYFQAMQILKGRYRGFTLGKYRVLERLGSGSNSSVFLCEHATMRRRVALKILPLDRAEDPGSLARFYREARAAGTLQHPNIVHTYDNGREGDVHFLVMEYVDGCSLHEIVQAHGPMDFTRAAAYIRQAAIGLQHIHQAGLIHRDMKPGNLLLERRGVVKILDLGLARFFHDHHDMLTQQYNQTAILGTADYLSPEQALNSHNVDTRTDIYGLGATFYYLLAGHPPFEVKAVSQKLLSHLTKEPAPLCELRPDIPEALAAVIEKMMAKNREKRYQSAAAVVVALAPWTQAPLTPPPAHEMPQLSPAALAVGPVDGTAVPAVAEAVPAVPHRKKQTHIPHTGFERPGVEAEAPLVQSEYAPSPKRRSRRAAQRATLSTPRPAPSPRPLPEKEPRLPDHWREPDTISSLSGYDTDPDMPDNFRHPEDARSRALARPQWRPPLRIRTIAYLVAAAIIGFALHALLPKHTVSVSPQEPLPRTIWRDVPVPVGPRPSLHEAEIDGF